MRIISIDFNEYYFRIKYCHNSDNVYRDNSDNNGDYFNDHNEFKLNGHFFSWAE